MPLEPSDTERVREIRCAIKSYAQAYERLECIQRCKQEEPLLPVGDQKTGAIGEFYALLYAKRQYEKAELAKNSQPGWDIKVWHIEKKRIQVKTVSAFSTTRRISPIHRGFDELWVLFLDRSLQPAGFWRIRESDLPWKEKKPLKGQKCPNPDQDGTGSQFLRSADNEVGELNLPREN